ncbi:hypothetical protein RN001_003459 [Aquatica leii]|uniref:HMG box domain-containing protein n=1 Tax=Aquatica leii TaxID=1421715 RepID=A0AAN7SRL3_9COLE|nr:hypothetical protein RN001_003459 [Aquatica leii]
MESSTVSVLNSGNLSTQKTEPQKKSNDQVINEVWTKVNFEDHKGLAQRKTYLKANLSLDLKPLKTSWASKNNDEGDVNDSDEDDECEFKEEPKELMSPTPTTPEKDIASPSHHARRPMNAFLIFCKKHRPIVRQRFPHLENRGVTRILGEWWALLETNEKSSYTNLAKEYKDAFFSANPNFKWYKLPAPPLRTLNTRPVNVYKISSPLASPTQTTPTSAEFNPGKLADETQLGNLTSLMQTNSASNIRNEYNSSVCEISHPSNDSNAHNNNNNNVENDSEQHKQLLITPVTDTISSFHPKPIKKRKFHEFSDDDNNKVSADIFNVNSSNGICVTTLDHNENTCENEQSKYNTNGFHNNDPENMTQQELMNKVVDSMFPDKDINIDDYSDKNEWNSKEMAKETRKSGRSCKGRRYVEFMMEGKLLGNKQMKRFTQYKPDIHNKFDNALNNKLEYMVHNKTETSTPKLDLGDTIKRLAERTNTKLEDINEDVAEGILANKNVKRKRTESENSDDSIIKLQSDFNLHVRIAELPSLSYEAFMQRKKDSKKRKSIRSKSESSVSKTKVVKLTKTDNNSLVGSKKRKNKNNIIRLEKPVDSTYSNDFSNDLFGLATLAAVAANMQKNNN